MRRVIVRSEPSVPSDRGQRPGARETRSQRPVNRGQVIRDDRRDLLRPNDNAPKRLRKILVEE